MKVHNEHNRAFKFVEKHYESSLLCLSLALCDIKLFNPVYSHLREKKLSAAEDDFFKQTIPRSRLFVRSYFLQDRNTIFLNSLSKLWPLNTVVSPRFSVWEVKLNDIENTI